MKLLASLLLFLSFAPAFAAPAELATAPDLVVKVRSGKSLFGGLSFAGSGVLFRDGKDAYVMTSEHVVVHSHSFRHTVENSRLGSIKAEIAAIDWGYGLALLKLKSLPEKALQTLPSRELFSTPPAQPNERVRVFGFPHQSDSAIETEGEIIATQSRRHAIPLLDTTLEILGAHGEYGMSGGPVFSSDEQSVSGILSHQYIEMTPGGRSLIRESRQSATTQNHLLAITANDVRIFLNRYFSNPSGFRASFIRDPEAQYAGLDAVISGDLRFAVAHPATNGTNNVGGGDAIGIGGGDVVGIGGGDAIGIGGLEPNIFKTPFVSIERTRSHSHLPTSWNIAHRNAWLSSLSKRVAHGGSIRVAYFVEMPSNSAPLRTNFFNTVGFVQGLLNPSLLPFSFSGDTQASANALQAIQKAGERLASRLSPLKSAPLTNTLSLIADAARSQEWSELKDLLNPEFLRSVEKNSGWDDLFYTQFETTVELMKILVEIRQLSEAK